MMQLADFASYDGLGLARLLERREVTSRELGQCVVEGIAATNPALNAVVEIYDDALEGLCHQSGSGRFRAIPVLTKDFPVEAGRCGELGSVIAKGLRPDKDYVFWTKLKAGGLVNLGRTTTSEFGITTSTESSLYGSTRNPWDPARGVAGSSGGAAAAVAAGIVPFAHGNDGGGSIRLPAAFCGIVGLKPSRGRVSGAPKSNAPLLGLSTSFMLTRSIRDAATLLDLVSGPVAGDSYEIAAPELSYARAIERPPSRLRIALCTDSWSGHPIEPEVVLATRAVGHRLEALGHTVVEASPQFDYEKYFQAQKIIWSAYTAYSVDVVAELLKREPNDSNLQTATLALYRHGKSTSATALLHALAEYDILTRQVGAFLALHDVLVTPTCPILPEAIGTHDPNRAGHTVDTVFDDLQTKAVFTAVFNAAGSPAISLPLGLSAAGLPIGVQFVSAFGREDLLLRLAAVLEAEYRWHLRVPPIHVARQ
jgi:amidase